MIKAGGVRRVAGDYLYRTQESFQFEGGIWASCGSHRKTSDWRLVEPHQGVQSVGGRAALPQFVLLIL